LGSGAVAEPRPTVQNRFKDTDIGPIPVEWEVVWLSEVADRPQYGYTASASEQPIGPRFLRITDIQERGVLWSTVPYCEADERALAKYSLVSGDLVFARIGATTGKTHLVTECPLSIFASYLIRVRVRPERLLPEYASFFTNTEAYWRQINASKGGRLKKDINIQVLNSLLIPLPPLPEQRRIAHVLSTIQRAVAAQEDVIVAAKETKRSLMQRLFTYGPGAEPAATKETEIGEIPVHWEVVRPEQLVDVKGGKRLPKGQKFADSPTDYPYIRVVDFENNPVNTTDLRFITREIHERIKWYTISSEDVYISIAGTTGIVGSVPLKLDGANLTENAAKLVIKNRRQLERRFLVYALASDKGQAEVSRRTTKTSQPKLALMRINQIPIPVPSLSEQERVVNALFAIDSKIGVEQQRKAALQALFQSMLQQLMTGQVRVTSREGGE
jgi:type I restriction enzyme S subunit